MNSRFVVSPPFSLVALVLTIALVAGGATGCSHAPPAPPTPPPALSDSAAAALRWVQAHAAPFAATDSTAPGADERRLLTSLVGDARVIGISELTEGTREFPNIVRRMLLALADDNVRGLAIQGPMPEAMELDRYVRTGIGDPRRLLRTLGDERWATREMLALVEAIRAWNVAHADRPIGFYGFEIPTGAHAIQVVTTMPDSVINTRLKAWLKSEYACVSLDEEAHWGAEGRAVDRPYWERCQGNVDAALDSIVALRQRTHRSPRVASDLAYTEEMARLLQHYVTVGLRRLPREKTVAEHTLYLLNSLGPDAKLLVWGGDVEAGRLTIDRTTVQMGVPLGDTLGERYRPIAFAFGSGTVRARRPAMAGRGGNGQSGPTSVPIGRPRPGSYEDVLSRVSSSGYWLDMRALPTAPTDTAAVWLHGPRAMRLVTGLYAPQAPQMFETLMEFPKYYDLVVFVQTVSAARPY